MPACSSGWAGEADRDCWLKKTREEEEAEGRPLVAGSMSGTVGASEEETSEASLSMLLLLAPRGLS